MELNLENFLKYLQLERNYSSYTIINYQEDIQEFFSFIKKRIVRILLFYIEFFFVIIIIMK